MQHHESYGTACLSEVAIIDDDATQRNCVARLVQSVGLTASVFESAEDFLRRCGSADDVACVLTDMRMPGMSGLQLQQELTSREVHVPLIVLTGHADVPAAVQSMKAGAFDFLEKPCSPQLLLETVQCAIRQCEEARRTREETKAIRDRFAMLSARERQVMHMVVSGISNKNIATKLKLSEKTVEFHRGNVMSKMQAQSLAELVRLSLHCPATSEMELIDVLLPGGASHRESLGKTPA